MKSAVSNRVSSPPSALPTPISDDVETMLAYIHNNLESAENYADEIETALYGPTPTSAAPEIASGSGIVGRAEYALKRLQRLNDKLGVIVQTL